MNKQSPITGVWLVYDSEVMFFFLSFTSDNGDVQVWKVVEAIVSEASFSNLKRASGSALQEYHLFLLSSLSTKDYIASHESIILSKRMYYKMLISDLLPMSLCTCISKPSKQYKNYFTKKNISSNC